jgi:hypothetical protein
MVSLSPYSVKTTRPILEVTLEIEEKKVTVFANHWPSQGNIDETRMLMAQRLKDLALVCTSDLVVAAGDFNTVSDDLLNGLTTHILPYFEDVETKGRYFSKEDAHGTHWHRGTWESLDKIFVLKRSLINNGIRINYSSFDIIKKAFMIRDLRWTDYDTSTDHFSMDVPLRFNSRSGEGFSDHLPVAVGFDL